MMLRLLLSHGYNVEMCLDFMCQGIFGNSFVWPVSELKPIPSWTIWTRCQCKCTRGFIWCRPPVCEA
ncbi:hypothetical protein DV515_00004382, partial [Chloebia gouldiae]